jgi:hypothetical protein
MGFRVISDNPYLTRSDKKDKTSVAYRNAPKHEKKIAKQFSGRVTARSGAGNMKGDVIVDGVLRIECKNTQKKSFSVTLDMINKIDNATAANGALPVIIVEFIDERGKKIKDVAIVPVWAIDALTAGR